MSKYDPLRDYLQGQNKPDFILTFEEIEAILGFALPRSAHRAEWWDDDTPEHPRLQREAVRDAGYDARRQPNGKTVLFRKMSAVRY
ncbi:MAG: hypothetical protein WEA28_08085 [Xanthobacteraceae bacterium]